MGGGEEEESAGRDKSDGKRDETQRMIEKGPASGKIN